MSATVLVVGSTGALGAPTAQRLREDGYKVRLLVRDLERLPQRSDDVEYVRGDLEDPDTLRSALLGCQAVHVSVRGGPTAEKFDRIEHRGTARLAQLAVQAGVNRLTYVSHSRVSCASNPVHKSVVQVDASQGRRGRDTGSYVDRGERSEAPPGRRRYVPDSWRRALAAPDAPAADLRAKFHAEEAIVASGVPYTIFRPTYFMDTLPRHLRGQRALVLGRQPHALHMVAAADFARLVSRSLAVPETAGRCLDVHGPEAITIPDALRTYCDQLAPDTRVVSMLLWFMKIVDRTLLKRQLSGTLGLMRALQQQGERGDPRQTNQLLRPVGTTLSEWLQTQPPP
jgi:uncharacterized protein YbjT (DUF2867 family)